MKICFKCGAQIDDRAVFCPNCGTNLEIINEEQVQFENPGYIQPKTEPTKSNKSRATAAILCFFLGGLGIHRFYAGKPGTALLMLFCSISGLFLFFPLIISGIWVIIDFLIIICGGFTDENGLTI